jgi:dTDP-4-amino-4,6-dideoxy-D-galactose acyltransferase
MKLALLMPDSNSDYDIQLKKVIEHIPEEVILISTNDLKLNLIELESIAVVISSNLSKEWCYLLRGLSVVTICFGCREYYIDLVDLVIDYKYADGDHYFTGPCFNYNHVSPSSFFEVTELVKKLDWDSKFFGINVAYISCLHLSENIYKAITKYISANNIQLIEYLCNCHDRRSVLIAEKSGFTFVDIRLTFVKLLKNVEPVFPIDGLIFRKATDADIPNLEAMAGQIYAKSRYFFDENFGAEKAKEFYESWIRKAVRGEFDDECWCLTKGEIILAFCSVRYTQSRSAQIGLLGVQDAYVGHGIGKHIVKRVIEMLAKKGTAELTVVTQGRNYSAQNLYQSIGFRTRQTQLWYHKWR